MVGVGVAVGSAVGVGAGVGVAVGSAVGVGAGVRVAVGNVGVAAGPHALTRAIRVIRMTVAANSLNTSFLLSASTFVAFAQLPS
jgi:hypothetical protein